MNQAPIRVEVHSRVDWLTPGWAQGAMDGSGSRFLVGPAVFSPATDVFLFYEETVTEPSLYLRVPAAKRFGLLVEPSPVSPSVALSLGHAGRYRRIFTHDPFLLRHSNRYRLNLFGTSWSYRPEDDIKAPLKSADISMITSNQSITSGHRLRLRLAGKLARHSSRTTIFGRNIPWGPFLPDRRDGVAPFRFSVVVENCRKENYFTEKLLDCFVTRTVPLYWGCPNIADFFDLRGVLTFADEREFWQQYERVVADPAGIYQACLAGLEENFRRALASYNVLHAWQSVGDAILDELAGPPPELVELPGESCLRSLLGWGYLVSEHCFRLGTTPFVPRRLRRAVAKMLPDRITGVR